MEPKSQKTNTVELLHRHDDATSNFIIEYLKNDDGFIELAKKETARILKRDQDDLEKLEKGIQYSIKRGILRSDISIPSAKKVFVENKNSDEVADEILSQVAGNADVGGVLVAIDGLSGTGKGTTVKKLLKKMPNSLPWSNGDVFRSLTYFVVNYLNSHKINFSEKELAPDLMKEAVGKIAFEENKNGFDLFVIGDNKKERVADIRDTRLKEPRVAERIPMISCLTQGEVINFTNDAVSKLKNHGKNIIIEGRRVTLRYLDTQNRFELSISDKNVLGQRRAAQRISAMAMDLLNLGSVSQSALINEALNKIIKED